MVLTTKKGRKEKEREKRERGEEKIGRRGMKEEMKGKGRGLCKSGALSRMAKFVTGDLSKDQPLFHRFSGVSFNVIRCPAGANGPPINVSPMVVNTLGIMCLNSRYCLFTAL